MESLYKEKYQLGEIISYLRGYFLSIADEEKRLTDKLQDNLLIESDRSIRYELVYDSLPYSKDLTLYVTTNFKDEKSKLEQIAYTLRYEISPYLTIKSDVKKHGWYKIMVVNDKIKISYNSEFTRPTFIQDISIKNQDEFIETYNQLMKLGNSYLESFRYDVDDEHYIIFSPQSISINHYNNSVEADITYYKALDQIVGTARKPFGKLKPGETDLDLAKFLLTEIPADKIPHRYLDLISYMRLKGYDTDIIDLCANAEIYTRKRKISKFAKDVAEPVEDYK